MNQPALRSALTSPYLLMTLCFVFWSGNSVFARGAADVMPPMNLAFWRWLVGILVLAPFAAPALWRDRRRYLERPWLFLIVAVSGVTGFNSFIYHAVQHTTAIHATLIVSAIPAVSAVAAWFAFRDTVTPRALLGMFVAFLGVVVVISRGEVAVLTGLDFNVGDLIALLAVVAWVVYSIGLRAMPRDVDPMGMLLGVMIVGWIGLIPLYLAEIAEGRVAALTLGNLAGIVYLGVFASVVAFAFFNYGVARLGPTRANVFNYLSPIFSGILAVLFLGERLAWFHGASIALIFVGIYLAQNVRRAAPVSTTT